MPAKKWAWSFAPAPLSCVAVTVLALALQFVAALPIQAQDSGKPSAAPHENWPSEPVRGTHGMVTTDEEIASHAGVEILKRGGNAIDSAVAVAFALAVVEPAAGNIGGGGFMLVRLADGRTNFLDYREVAPGKASRDMYIGADGKLIPN